MSHFLQKCRNLSERARGRYIASVDKGWFNSVPYLDESPPPPLPPGQIYRFQTDEGCVAVVCVCVRVPLSKQRSVSYRCVLMRKRFFAIYFTDILLFFSGRQILVDHGTTVLLFKGARAAKHPQGQKTEPVADIAMWLEHSAAGTALALNRSCAATTTTRIL